MRRCWLVDLPAPRPPAWPVLREYPQQTNDPQNGGQYDQRPRINDPRNGGRSNISIDPRNGGRTSCDRPPKRGTYDPRNGGRSEPIDPRKGTRSWGALLYR